jgi:hypothetical protein
LNNPLSIWLNKPLIPVQSKKPFLIISSMVYLCNEVTPNHQIKKKNTKPFCKQPQYTYLQIGIFEQLAKSRFMEVI